MAGLRLRDRDSIITAEGLIFRVFGYSHPADAYICDLEYAPSKTFKSDNPKAFRSNDGKTVFYKFYEDEGWKFIQRSFPQYAIFHVMLQRRVVGVPQHCIAEARKPCLELARLVETKSGDPLLEAMQDVLECTLTNSGLLIEDFGVFGSLLHGFHHPDFSDLDFTVYGSSNIVRLREVLRELYGESSSRLRNEFETTASVSGKCWRFVNYDPKEFVWHQRRKLIYALFRSDRTGRVIKTEFELVKGWKEIVNDYDVETRIVCRGWVRLLVRIVGDEDAPFIPSVYDVEPLKVLEGQKGAEETVRVVSYLEEFRLQAFKDEIVYVEGNLEQVITSKGSFFQVVLTYSPRYYEQVLKVVTKSLDSSNVM